jgi:hypothetical protein
MNKNYPYKGSMKRKYYDKWLKNQEAWQKRKVVPYTFYAIAAVVFVASCIFLLWIDRPQDITFFLILTTLFAGSVLGLAPWVIGVAFSMKWKSQYGAPFSAMTKEFLLATEYGLEFGYVRKVWNDWNMAEVNRRVVFRIRFAEIEFMDLDQDSNICTIGGRRGRITMYDDPAMQTYQPYNSYELSPNEAFKFIFAFRDQEEFVERVKNEVKEGVWGKKPDGIL